ncbi:hypothetical protein [Rhizobium sp.]
MLDMYVTRERFMLLASTSFGAAGPAGLVGSGGTLRDICRENRIALPKRTSCDRDVVRNMPKLAPRELGQNPYVHFTGDFGADEQRLFLDELLSEPFEALEPMVARFRKRMNRINASDNPFGLHPAIIDVLPAGQTDRFGPDLARDNQNGTETRCLNLLNEIFGYVDAVGGHCQYGGTIGARHRLTIGHIALFVRLSRAGKSDGLCLEVGPNETEDDGQLLWADNGRFSLENMLPDIMVQIGIAAETVVRQRHGGWREWSPPAVQTLPSMLAASG